ncbi:MAG: SDR family oxidoreductase, partial [Methanomicrobiales archaeon]|nr:SDR family oxidoreductase [Methanomicrobiales archaeon]
MKFLVTGGAGFIGSHLARELANLGEVTVLDDLSSGHGGRIQDLLDKGKVQFVRGNILHRNLLLELCRGVDCIFHLAADVSVTRSMERPLEVHEVNATGTLSVLSSAREAGVKKLIFSSTAAVYGDSQVSPKPESTCPEPLSPYAASKLAGEYYCEVYRRSYGLPTASLRYFNVYGPAQDPRGEYAAVIPSFIMNVLRRRSPVIFGDGSQIRDFVSVQDVVRANILAMQRDAIGPFNIATGDGVSVRDLARVVGEIGGLSREPVFEKPRPGDIRESVADISRARDVMGYRPRVHLVDGLRETMEWFR